jgi:hypothetical protein
MAKIEVAGIQRHSTFAPVFAYRTLPLSFVPFSYLAVACEPVSRLASRILSHPCSTSKTPFV